MTHTHFQFCLNYGIFTILEAQISNLAEPKIKKNGTFSAKFPKFNAKLNLNFNTHSIKILNGLAIVGCMRPWPTRIAHLLTLSILTKCQNCLAALAAIRLSFPLIAAKSAADTSVDSPTSRPLNSRLSTQTAVRDAQQLKTCQPSGR